LSRVAVVDTEKCDIDDILNLVAPDIWQLHGEESQESVREFATRMKRPVIKAISISSRADIDRASQFDAVADMLLFDKPKAHTNRMRSSYEQISTIDLEFFDRAPSTKPWFLAGGLTPNTIESSIKRVRPDGVDVSSGVESAPGAKSPRLIEAFCRNAKAAYADLSRHDK
jgi:phosphoribosylanthranilate isomerase